MRRLNYLLTILGFIVFNLLANTLTCNAQVKVENKAYALMLSALLNHSVPEIDVDSLELNPTVYLLDARAYKEFEISHLQNARWVGFDEFNIQSVADIPKNAPIVVYCSVGYRSEKIVKQLVADGFKNSSNLYGGIFEWVNQNNPIVGLQNEPTQKVHAFSKNWGIWLTKGEKVYN